MMHIYLAVILASLIGGYLLGLAAHLFGLRALDPALPAEFQGWYDPEQYARSQEYTRAKTRFSMVHPSVGTAFLVAFLLAGGFAWVQELAAAPGWSEIPTGLLFVAILGLGADMLALPFSLYATFVLEARFGFNTTTPGLYIKDKLKGYALTVLIGGPLLAALLFFFQAAGPWAWVCCWAAMVAVSVLLNYLAPTLIMPLFNKFTPLEDGELRQAIEACAAKAGVDVADVSLMDGSKRSTKANAFFAGFGKKKRIALFDTLVDKHSTDEIVAVLAHEIGHQKLGHILRNLALVTAKTGVLFYVMSLFLRSPELHAAFGLDEVHIHSGLIFFLLLYSPVSTLLGVGFNAVSRRHEYQADAYAARLTGHAENLVIALKRLTVTNLGNLTPHPLQVVLEYSHPPVLDRIRALRSLSDRPSASR